METLCPKLEVEVATLVSVGSVVLVIKGRNAIFPTMVPLAKEERARWVLVLAGQMVLVLVVKIANFLTKVKEVPEEEESKCVDSMDAVNVLGGNHADFCMKVSPLLQPIWDLKVVSMHRQGVPETIGVLALHGNCCSIFTVFLSISITQRLSRSCRRCYEFNFLTTPIKGAPNGPPGIISCPRAGLLFICNLVRHK
jgi:hypothetical protein